MSDKKQSVIPPDMQKQIEELKETVNLSTARIAELEMQWNLQKPQGWYVQQCSFHEQKIKELETLLYTFANPSDGAPLTECVQIWKPRPSGSQSSAMLEAKAACSNIEKLLRSELKQLLETCNAAQDMVNAQQQQLTKLEAACCEKNEAIEGILHLWNGHEEKCDEKGCAVCELKNALNSSTCGQGMLEDSKMLDWLEENRSNSKIEYIYSPEHKVCISLYKDGVWWHRAFGSTLREAIKAAMSTHQTTKEK